MVCSDCRQYFKCYGEFPCLEPPGQQAASPDPCSNEEEIDFDEEEEIDEPDQDETKPLIQTQNSLGGELNLTAIERDSDLTGDNPELDDEVNVLASFLNPNHCVTRFLPQPLLFGSWKKSNPIS